MRDKADGSRERARSHSDEILQVYERMLDASLARGRHIELSSGRRVYVIEAGEGPPLLFLHGTSTSSLSVFPLLEHLEGVRLLAVDRPGFGLSEPDLVPREHFRNAAVEFVGEVIDELGLEAPTLAGGSMGGTCALWYALAHPDRVRRLALIGSAPLLPGTSPPAVLRVNAAPVIGDLLARVVKPNAKMVVRLMSSMGEKNTIVRHPDLLEAIATAGRDPVASAANLAELRAIMTPLGFRRSARVGPDELRRLTVPTLFIWGDRDPVGGSEVAQAAAGLVREARLELRRQDTCPTSATRSERPSSCPSSFARWRPPPARARRRPVPPARAPLASTR